MIRAGIFAISSLVLFHAGALHAKPKHSRAQSDRSAIVYSAAVELRGTSTRGLAPKGLECAAAINLIVAEATGKPVCNSKRTDDLFRAMNNSSRWDRISISSAKEGDIIISPSRGKNHGHVGVIIEGGRIISNSSKTGKISDHQSINGWIRFYKQKKGLDVYVFRLQDA